MHLTPINVRLYNLMGYTHITPSLAADSGYMAVLNEEVVDCPVLDREYLYKYLKEHSRLNHLSPTARTLDVWMTLPLEQLQERALQALLAH